MKKFMAPFFIRCGAMGLIDSEHIVSTFLYEEEKL